VHNVHPGEELDPGVRLMRLMALGAVDRQDHDKARHMQCLQPSEDLPIEFFRGYAMR
jgi:hypothetical protein